MRISLKERNKKIGLSLSSVFQSPPDLWGVSYSLNLKRLTGAPTLRVRGHGLDRRPRPGGQFVLHAKALTGGEIKRVYVDKG